MADSWLAYLLAPYLLAAYSLRRPLSPFLLLSVAPKLLLSAVAENGISLVFWLTIFPSESVTVVVSWMPSEVNAMVTVVVVSLLDEELDPLPEPLEDDALEEDEEDALLEDDEVVSEAAKERSDVAVVDDVVADIRLPSAS
jgi:hypothetical protein